METDYEGVLEYLRSGEAKVEDLADIRAAINEVVPDDASLAIAEAEAPYWNIEGNQKAILLGETVVNLVQRGRPQLKQIGMLREWISVWARPIMEKATKSKKGDSGEELGIDMIIQLLDPEALLELGCVITMMDEDFVGDNFDIGWLLDAVGRVVKHQPAIRRLTQGFFGKLG